MIALAVLGIAALMVAPVSVSASAPPSTPFMIYGWVFYEDGSECDYPIMNVNNTNTDNEWSTEIKTNASYNYYQLMLANGTDMNESEVLRFNVTTATGNQSNIKNYTLTQENITEGGLFNFNISLASVPAGICGDVNGDGEVTGYDDTVLALYIGEVPGWTISSEWAADVNGDGEVTGYDDTVLALYIGEVPGWELNCK